MSEYREYGFDGVKSLDWDYDLQSDQARLELILLLIFYFCFKYEATNLSSDSLDW